MYLEYLRLYLQSGGLTRQTRRCHFFPNKGRAGNAKKTLPPHPVGHASERGIS